MDRQADPAQPEPAHRPGRPHRPAGRQRRRQVDLRQADRRRAERLRGRDCTATSKMQVGWFHQHQIEAMDPTDTPLEIIRRAMPDASESQPPLAAGPVRPRLREAGNHGRQPVRRRARAPAAEHGGDGRAAPPDPRRTDQPPRHRQPPRPAGRAERLRGRGHPDHPRPLADGAGRRPPVAGRRRHGEALRRRHGRLRRSSSSTAPRPPPSSRARSRTKPPRSPPPPRAARRRTTRSPAPRPRPCVTRSRRPRSAWPP